MELYSGHINKLIEELAALPGIGGKSLSVWPGPFWRPRKMSDIVGSVLL